MAPCRTVRGFTLIEAIIAIVVLSLAIPPMLWAMRDATWKRADPVLVSRARWLAAEKLEDVLADRHSATRGYAYVVAANYPVEAAVTGFTGFSRSVAITEGNATLVPGSGAGYKTVSVSVGFRDARNNPRTRSLSTVVTEYTP